ncbi:type 1 glutamine amidotransferase family protein [Roseiconus lacunae]|uniref:ThuA domain-containing protein n=1 Tax=Roseiconus lacunae TaxID=2605694 RepID=UPI0011F34EEC|nr:ThuA domain-containing protein [Roseiconus lacunae]
MKLTPPPLNPRLTFAFPSLNTVWTNAFQTLCCLTLVLIPTAAIYAAEGVLKFPAKGESHGKIVLVSGDEEYRTEESMPMLAKILSVHHGYDCVVLFSMSEDGTHVDPNNSQGVVGWEQLDDADLMIIGTRFRQPSAEDAKHVTKFIDAGKPLIGFRTSTHAFNGKGQFGPDLPYGDFGLKILGERWVNHHGRHKKEGARSVVVDAHADHPILSSVDEIFASSDVYGVIHLTDDDLILLRAAVTETLDPSSPNVSGEKNSPMQPFAWIHPYTSPSGTSGKSFCTTAGASVDFADEDLRRLIVNAAYHLTGRDVPAKANVTFVDPYYPTFYGFIREKGYWKNLNIQPSDFSIGKAPSFPDPKGSPEWNHRDRP